ncbi:PLP-dependent aspartate aminotransferase family protein [Megasphaera sp. DJF_B143]|uniref:trans-sulfuration enzyme family protein n=1 Tax=Megasphaera sp. DJF_B143 TaxID=537288 RepID=UPI00073FA265|nr:aminotransferase class I/II-fold pyridoxal phosphate-dependent enzyme [Megasphaera sp. DJF_B143]KUH57419.1 methionine gamma-lyase [Megasphaera sp. DJF_B143]MDY2905513.1 aminotransferase class I/II-fold pyridoxal phosphate-dependent enzyme [Caecibacter massiliensis]
MGINTDLLHKHQLHAPLFGDYKPVAKAHISPIYQTSTYILDDFDSAVYLNQHVDKGFVYSRFGSPNCDELEKKIASLEHAEAGLALASGLGAISTAVMSVIKSGDHVVFGDVIYGCTYTLFTHILTHMGVEYTRVDTTKVEEVEKAIKPNTTLVYVETPANPTLKISDIQAIADCVHSHKGITLIVDSTFASPYLQNPIDLGADMVVHSATKYLNGHGTVTAGVIAGPKERIDKCRMPYLQCFGAVLDPFAAWLLMQGMKTLGIRMERHCSNAMKIAQWLEKHPKIEHVYYPGLPSHPTYEIAKKQMHNGFGGMMSADIKGGEDAVRTVMNNVKVFSLATSLGNVDSLIQHSPSMSHFDMTPEERHAASIFDGQVRLSIGIEDVEDLIADLDQALALI